MEVQIEPTLFSVYSQDEFARLVDLAFNNSTKLLTWCISIHYSMRGRSTAVLNAQSLKYRTSSFSLARHSVKWLVSRLYTSLADSVPNAS
jgi:hypothetical protein